MEYVFVFFLILLNGVLAMAEIAVISARKSKLQHLISKGDKKAQSALNLANSPNRFLSTVQVGITLVAILAGAFGEAAIADDISKYINMIPFLHPYGDTLSLIVVVALITYLSVIVGELVPKRLALSNPEKIAAFLAEPMNMLSSITAPVVSLLSISTDWILKLFRLKPSVETGISEDEIRLLIKEGARTGIFNITEKDIVERTFQLSDKKVSTLMTPKKEIVWLDVDSSFNVLKNKIVKQFHSHYPIYEGTPERVIGVVRTETILVRYLAKQKVDLKRILHKPLYVPENADGLKVLEMYKKSGIHMALVVDEYGNIQGLVTLSDIVEAIVGDVPTVGETNEEEIKKRDDGTWLVDGLVSIDEFKRHFHIRRMPEERSGEYNTIGGFVMYKLERVPIVGDKVEVENLIFEVMDMDGNRIDKILIRPAK